MHYIKLVRPLNLFLIVFMLAIFKYGFLTPLDVQVAMGTLDFSLLVIATVLIAAGGYVINDIQDVAIDKINRSKRVIVTRFISEKNAYTYFIILNILGVGCAFVMANRLGIPQFAALAILGSALLYSYALYLKRILLVGNIIVSLLVAQTAVLLIIFDILPAINTDRMALQVAAAKVLLLYAIFAFVINFIREIVKDIEDVNGDKNGDCNSLPIVIGRKRTMNVVFALGALSVIGVVYYMLTVLYSFQMISIYFLLLVLGPLLFFCIKSWSAETQKDYKLLSNLLKAILFFGICSILFYPEVILN